MAHQTSEQQVPSPTIPAPLFHPSLPKGVRYGVLCWILATLGLLLAADVSGGVRAIAVTTPSVAGISDPNPVEKELLTVSIFSAVRELWLLESYALAIFVCLASVIWPFVKLLSGAYTWCHSFPKSAEGIANRDRFLLLLDVAGKWSLVDEVLVVLIFVTLRYGVS
jgi:Paraquat-inducible protein A